MDVSIWEAPSKLPSGDSTFRAFPWLRLIGAGGSLFLHAAIAALVVRSVVLEARPPHPTASLLGTRFDRRAAGLVPVFLPLAFARETYRTHFTEMLKDLPRDDALVASLPMPIAVDNDPDDGHGALMGTHFSIQARWAGIYSGQIRARIERQWRRPRSPVSDARNPKSDEAEYFSCQIQIVQDSHGSIQEILVPTCNGSAAWQRSLIAAIQQSSPLPAPPDPTVFSQIITMNFIGYPYQAGESADGYENERAMSSSGFAD